MNAIPFEDLLNLVLVTNERVQFSHIDPYGHLNAAKYLEFFLNHRIHAAEELLQCHTMDIVKQLGVGFVVQDLAIKYLSPTFQSEVLEIGSWVEGKSPNGFTLILVASGSRKRRAKAIAKIQFVSVDVKTGKVTELPNSLPIRTDDYKTGNFKKPEEYVGTIEGFPSDFVK